MFPEIHLSFSLRMTFLTVGNFLRGIYKVNYFLQCFWAKWSSQNPGLSLLRDRGSWNLRHSEGLLCCLSSSSGNEDKVKWERRVFSPHPQLPEASLLQTDWRPLTSSASIICTSLVLAWSAPSCSFGMVRGNSLSCTVWWLILITSSAGFRITMEMSLISLMEVIPP